mmetsp:Transcript_29814/g.70976  ORF Transcript_29814/g.70976 Transcript_29814/m.70976 type:complete len:312 (-) Transcript_29814:87-1022(-)
MEDPLVVARAMLAPESKAEEAMRVAMMPWLTFMAAGWLFLYCYEHLPSFVVVLLCTWALMCLCTLLAMQRPKAAAAAIDRKHGLVVVLSLVSLLAGIFMGQWNYSRSAGVADYWAVGRHQHYSDVAPAEPAAAHRDAAALGFEKGSRPDARMTAAYTGWGQNYCVAPVASLTHEYTGVFTAQYFAVGKDCCKDMEFTCGEALNQAAHAGLVLFNRTQDSFSWIFGKQDLDYYMQAARMSAARFGIHLATQPIFLTWVSDTASAQRELWPQARNVWLLSSMLALPVFAVVSFACEAVMANDVAGRLWDKDAV